MADENTEVMETTDTTETLDTSLENTETETLEDTDTSEEHDGVDENGEGARETTEEEDTEFDPDNLEFEESEDYKFGDYDLSKFKENLNFSDENVRNYFNGLSTELKEQGFTQGQIEWLMQKEIDAVVNKKDMTPTKEQVMQELHKNLTLQEKRNYKAVGNYFKEAVKGTELEKYYKEAMANPAVYKILNVLYNKTLSGKPLKITNSNKEVKKTGVTLDDAINGYGDYLSKHLGDGEDRTPIINKYLKTLTKENQKKFKETFGIK